MGLGGSGAGKQIPSSEEFHTQRMTWERSPAQPRATEPPWPWQQSCSCCGCGVCFSSGARAEQPHGGSAHRATGWSLLMRWIRVDSNGLNTTHVVNLDSDRSKPVNNEIFAYHQSDSLHITSVLAVLCFFLDSGYASSVFLKNSVNSGKY